MALARLFFDNDSDFDRMLSARLNPSWLGSASSAAGAVDRWTPKFDIVQNEVSYICDFRNEPSLLTS